MDWATYWAIFLQTKKVIQLGALVPYHIFKKCCTYLSLNLDQSKTIGYV
jgi:hypothetical protein